MINFLLLYGEGLDEELHSISGEFPSKRKFLDQLPDHVLKHYNWTMYKIEEAETKKQMVHSGNYDDVIPE